VLKIRHFAALLLCAATITAQAKAPVASKLGEGCHLRGFSDPLRCMKIKVPSNYQAPEAASIEIFVTIAPSLREQAKPDPLFILAGGPGQAGSSLVGLLNHSMQKVRATRDVIFIDQRGTGRSGKLDCPHFSDQNLSLTENESLQVFKSCAESYAVNLSDYTTANAARDLDFVRATLGYEQINVWGGSYGTRLAQTYARLFPGQTRALILDGVASPEQILGVWSKDAQASLTRLFEQCAQDTDCNTAFPQLAQDFEQVRTAVRNNSTPVSLLHPRTAEQTEVPFSYEMFADTVRTALYTPAAMSGLPQLISQASQGNFKPIVTGLLTFMEWSQDSMSMLLTFSVACAEDIPYLDQTTIDEEINSGFLEGLQAKTWPKYCQQLSVPTEPRHSTDNIAQPVLLLSGEYDPVTPPWRAEQAMQHMSKAQHIVVPQLAHGVSNIGCAPKLLRQFLDQPEAKVDAACLLETRFPPFVISAAGPKP